MIQEARIVKELNDINSRQQAEVVKEKGEDVNKRF
jgi:hypothetical protein